MHIFFIFEPQIQYFISILFFKSLGPLCGRCRRYTSKANNGSSNRTKLLTVSLNDTILFI